MVASKSLRNNSEITRESLTSIIAQLVDVNFDWVYFSFHVDRYVDILKFVNNYIHLNSTSYLRILDVGPSYQTALLRNFFPDIKIDTLGYNHKANNLREGEIHLHKDLNQTMEVPVPEVCKNYDLILCCEVMEHIYTNPFHLLIYFEQMLKSKGTLFIQTPNAVAIHKRIKMVMGRNPYPKLEDNRQGHFREYTGQEVIDYMMRTNLEISSVKYKNHFGLNSNLLHRLFKKLSFMMPPSFRDGMTIIGNKS